MINDDGRIADKKGSSSKLQGHFAEVTICNRRGLHARASAQFVKCAEKFNAKIQVTRDGQSVGGTSIMGLMVLAAEQGSIILIEATGLHSAEALEALIALVEAGFHEEH